MVSKEFKYQEVAIQTANLFYDELINSKEILEEFPEAADYAVNGVDGSHYRNGYGVCKRVIRLPEEDPGEAGDLPE